MSLNFLNKLKRRLEDESVALSKRLCLAKNMVHSHHLPSAPKERIVGEWLQILINNELSSDELRNILMWVDLADDITNELKSKLIQIVFIYIQRNTIQIKDVNNILSFLENNKLMSQLALNTDNYICIAITLLQYLKNNEKENFTLSERLLNNLRKYYRESGKKLEFITKLLKSVENLETLFSYLDTECGNAVMDLCENILFPIKKKSFFFSYLQSLIRKNDLKELIAEKGDNIQSVLKIMAVFFEFPKGKTDTEWKFLRDYINVFICCYRSESQLVFAFTIMVINYFDMQQNCITPVMNLSKLEFKENDEKIKRNLFLNLLEILLKYEVDLNVRLTDTFGENISNMKTKKNFMTFLQAVLVGQIKVKGKVDKTTLKLIKTALLLDPVCVELILNEILPQIMTVKKNNSKIIDLYIDMLNCLLKIIFKLGKGTLFIDKIIPSIKKNLEASNTQQTGITENREDCVNLIRGNDIFPQECVEVYGKLTSELMFKNNKELFESLIKQFQDLTMLEKGFVNPSIVTLTEVLASIISAFISYSKIADHTVPLPIAQDFWNALCKFENNTLRRFGECILKLDNNPSLLHAYLKLCLGVAHLKLLNMKYSNVKLEMPQLSDPLDVFDISAILSVMNVQQWNALASKVVEDEAVILMNDLLICKTMAIKIISQNSDKDLSESVNTIKSHLIQQISSKPQSLESNQYLTVLLADLDQTQCVQIAKHLIEIYNPDADIFDNVAIQNNRNLLNALALETARIMSKLFKNSDLLTKSLKKLDFNIASFVKDIDVIEYFKNISIEETIDMKKYLHIIKKLQIHNLNENCQLTIIFIMLAVKKCCNTKKNKSAIDSMLQTVYELSAHPPDLYQIFSVNFIFDEYLFNLLNLTIKTSNKLLVVKCLLESAVKRVKNEPVIVKSIVSLLLSKQKNKETSIDLFSDPAFETTCMILPLIVKQKKNITASVYRSILADLQDKLQKYLLETFKDIDFSRNSVVCDGNTENNMVEADSELATLNAIAAYSLTLSRYCETTDAEEIKNLDCLWSGLEYFVRVAIVSIQSSNTKQHHTEASIQLLNVILRHIKKLESHKIFEDKDKLLIDIWKSIKSRLLLIHSGSVKRKYIYNLDDISVTLKFLCELSSVECFSTNFVGDLSDLICLKKPSIMIKDNTKSDITAHIVSKYLWINCLKANIVGPKCVAMSKLMFASCKNINAWIRQHYDTDMDGVARKKKRKYEVLTVDDDENDVKIVKVDDVICDLLKINLDSLSEVVLAAKKISLDYKFLDSIFEVLHMVQYILGLNSLYIRCEVSWQSFFTLYEGSLVVLNNLLVSREELLEDRWPCYMQCYRCLMTCLCERATSQVQLEKSIEDKLAEMAHSIEKLSQSISKRKRHVSRIASYTVADVCATLERTSPTRLVRQHLDNCVALLLQTADSTYSMAFLRRALAGSPGQVTVTNLYTMYKRYHKYVGNT